MSWNLPPWNLPPGCTDKDVDDAAPQEQSERCDACQKFFPFSYMEWYFVRRHWVPFCPPCAKKGYVEMMPEREYE